MMKRLLRLPFVLLLVLAGCAVPPAATTPVGFTPLAPGMARIVFYRDVGYYDPAVDLTVALNDKTTGVLTRGTVFYRDVTPGTYNVTFTPTRPAPEQFVTITPAAGNVFYVKLLGLPDRFCGSSTGSTTAGCDISGFVARLVDPVQAQQEVQRLSLVQG
jgi:hypothetical protein